MTIRSRTLAVLAALLVGIGTLLAVQSAKHGWPFSMRLNKDAAGGAMQAHEGHGIASPSPTRTDDQATRTGVALDNAQFERLGISLEPARLEAIDAMVRHVATIIPDETRISHVHARVSGWIEELYVNTTGETVKAGQRLAAVFSQELYASQTEYLTALRQSRDTPGSAVLSAARTRLAVLGMTEREIVSLEREGVPRRLVTLVAPRPGVVMRRGVSVGTAIDPSTELFTIIDLAQVWVIAEVPEAYAPVLAVGVAAALDFTAAGGPSLSSIVDFIYPTLTERTRSVRVRFVLPNPNGALRPGMYGTASFNTDRKQVLTIPRDAVVETGQSQHVFVQTSDGILEPRKIRLGARFADRCEVVEGLAEGEEVVSSGVFLIDSESRLRASGAATHREHGAATPDGAGREE